MNGRVESVEICINAVWIDDIPAFQQGTIKCFLQRPYLLCKEHVWLAYDGRDHWNVVNFDCEDVLEAWSTRSCNHQAIGFLSHVILWDRVGKLWTEERVDTTLIYSNEHDPFTEILEIPACATMFAFDSSHVS